MEAAGLARMGPPDKEGSGAVTRPGKQKSAPAVYDECA